jgi:hypothetical protein
MEPPNSDLGRFGYRGQFLYQVTDCPDMDSCVADRDTLTCIHNEPLATTPYSTRTSPVAVRRRFTDDKDVDTRARPVHPGREAIR